MHPYRSKSSVAILCFSLGPFGRDISACARLDVSTEKKAVRDDGPLDQVNAALVPVHVAYRIELLCSAVQGFLIPTRR